MKVQKTASIINFINTYVRANFTNGAFTAANVMDALNCEYNGYNSPNVNETSIKAALNTLARRDVTRRNRVNKINKDWFIVQG